MVEKTLTKENPEKFWGKNFLRPVGGIVTMAYGTREFVNKKYSARHRGIDYRAKIGTIVRAPCSGKIVFVEHLKAFGGTMVIDHGQGVQSIFFHLSKFLAEVGTSVEKGQRVAKTGNSGISTGPHLHYGLSVNNVRVDPTLWIKGII
jgi:murein DD-endopeptidase MepM/ murein hydrolase activator NlpD